MKQLLQHLNLGQEAGTLQTYAKCFGKPDTLNCIVFENQLSNQRIFAMPHTQGSTRLYTQELIGNNWTEPQQLAVLDLQEGEKIHTKSSRKNASWLLIYIEEVKDMPIVCLDAGHGIDTPGKRSPDGTLLEYEFNRDVANRIEDILALHDVEVITC